MTELILLAVISLPSSNPDEEELGFPVSLMIAGIEWFHLIRVDVRPVG